ncbi:MAG: heme-binding protein [Rhodospirillaceae bacterium]
MKTIMTAALAGLFAVSVSNTPAGAQDTPLVYSLKSLTPEAALKVAQETLKACRAEGYQAAVAVVDRGGSMLVMLRDRFAGPHTPETARRKAWTALSFRTNTVQMAENTQAGKEPSGVRHVPGALMLGGGVLVRAGGALVGAVGVSGAPGGQADEDCAVKGIATIQDDLDF